MFNVSERLLEDVPAIRGLLKFEPEVGLDFSDTDLLTMLAVMSCLMETGVVTGPAIYGYLVERGCRLNRRTVDFLLDQYDGDDPRRHLWKLQDFGEYRPLSHTKRSAYGGGPAWSGDNEYITD